MPKKSRKDKLDKKSRDHQECKIIAGDFGGRITIKRERRRSAALQKVIEHAESLNW